MSKHRSSKYERWRLSIGASYDADIEAAWEHAERTTIIATGITGGRTKYRRPNNPNLSTLRDNPAAVAAYCRKGSGAVS